MARLWRAFHEAGELGVGVRVTLGSDEAHHVRRVLRLGVGEPLAVFDGRGGEWVGTIETCDPRTVTVVLAEPQVAPVEAPIDLTLFQGRSRPERFELVVQKATELGVREIVSVECERSDGKRPDARRIERFRRLAIEACKQCGRRRLPDLRSADELPAVEPGVTALLLDTSDAPALGTLLGRNPDAGGAVWLAVGPEGGFSGPERTRAIAAGWQPGGLGPRTLRTETAGIVGVAILLHRGADLGAASGIEGPG